MPYTPSFDRSKAQALWPQSGAVDYLNHGSYGFVPQPVRDDFLQHSTAMLDNPMHYLCDEYGAYFEQNHRALSALMHCPPDDLVLVQGATEGVNAVIKSLALTGQIKAGDQLLRTSHGYNACNNVLHSIAQQTGARVVVAEMPFPLQHEDEVVGAILAAVTDKTKFALIDHITSPTALLFPVARIVYELKQRGVECLIDGAHACGMVEVDVPALGAAFYVGNGHKWLGAAPGVGFLYVRPDLQHLIEPVTMSHGYNDSTPNKSLFQKQFAYNATRNYAPWFTLNTAITTLNSLHPNGLFALMEDNRQLVKHGYDLMLDALGQKPYAPVQMLTTMASVLVPAGPQPDSHVAMRHYIRDHFNMVMQVVPYSSTQRVVRLSAHAYNQPEQYEKAARAVTSALRAGV
jgi:isopenicillin-N epimerase